ncbi:MAG TPA: transporter substrate-binding domain-containing protein [bacterium]|nr:transporter substrate-binding domain-containing protein [bacterium]
MGEAEKERFHRVVSFYEIAAKTGVSVRSRIFNRGINIVRTSVMVMLVFICCGVAWATETVQVGIYQNKPKVFVDENGKSAGIFIDLLDEIAESEGWNLVYRQCEWEACLRNLESGVIDLMPDVAYSDERAEKYVFHKIPVVESWSQVYAGPGSRISRMSDLKGLRVTSLRGSIQEKILKQMMNGYGCDVTIVQAGSYEEAFGLVMEGYADAVVSNRFFGDYSYQNYGLAKTPVVFNVVPLYYAATRGGNKELLNKIDEYLDIWSRESDSPYYKILYRWEEKPPSHVVPRYLLLIIGLIAFLLLFTSGMILLLRRQVRSRTKHLELANEELQKHQENLEGLVDMRTAELEKAKVAAEDADRLKSVFMASMSHELRTPLNSIIGFTGIILMGLSGELNDEQKKQLGMVKSSSEHLLSLISDVLDISKIEAGRIDLSHEEFDMRDIVNEVVITISPEAEKKDLKVVTEVPGEINMLSDRRRVKQILMNLVGNAVKFTQEGYVKISVGIADDGFVEICVTDTGIGISRENMHLLFNPFRQIGDDFEKKSEGTGLGLHLCKRLVALLGGKIWAESEFGRGSAFMFSIPIRSRETINEEDTGNRG